MKTFNTLITIILLSFQFTSKAQNVTSYESYKGSSLVEVTINGEKAWALIDPQIPQTVFHRSDAGKLGYTLFPEEKNFKVEVADKVRAFNRVSAVEMEMAGQQLYGLKLACNLNDIITQVKAATGKRISVIIGSNMMKHHGFILDLGNEIIEVPALFANNTIKKADSISLN